MNDQHKTQGKRAADQPHQAGDPKAKTIDTNSPRTRDPAEQQNVWEEEGGSPPEQISSTKSVKPESESKPGSMGAVKDSGS